jgi:hypothetical protein
MDRLEDHAPPDNEPGHHPDHEQDKPDLDAFAEKLGIEPDEAEPDKADEANPEGGASPVETMKAAATSAREMAGTAREMAEPVAHLVQDAVGRAARAIDERRHLADRVEHLEAEVADLRARLERVER